MKAVIQRYYVECHCYGWNAPLQGVTLPLNPYVAALACSVAVSEDEAFK